MPKNNSTKISIVAPISAPLTSEQIVNAILNKSIENVTVTNINVQPIYNLQRDTISTFLYESKELLSLEDKRDSYICLEFAILSLALTANNFQIGDMDVTDHVIGALWLAFAWIGYLLKQIRKQILENQDKLTVKALTEELGKRAILSIEMAPQNNR